MSSSECVREQRGRELATRLRIVQNSLGKWIVPSDSGQGKYTVDPESPSCSCVTFSARRFMTDLRDAYECGYMTKPIHYNSIFKYLEDEALTPVLRAMVTVTSLPLKTVDVSFAVDSSGFGSSKFIKWFDVRHGTERRQAEWVKCHLTAGTRTGIVTAVHVERQDTGDAPNFPAMVNATARNFTVKEVMGDKAYSSVMNLQTVTDLGAMPLIPFRSNTTHDKGGLWSEMFTYFCENRDRFMERYNKRSNVESVFSAIKRKFGDAVRSKTDVAMMNEVLTKVVAHNVCVVNHEMHELGIAGRFWNDDVVPDGNPNMILPFRRPG
jgi:transposase